MNGRRRRRCMEGLFRGFSSCASRPPPDRATACSTRRARRRSAPATAAERRRARAVVFRAGRRTATRRWPAGAAASPKASLRTLGATSGACTWPPGIVAPGRPSSKPGHCDRRSRRVLDPPALPALLTGPCWRVWPARLAGCWAPPNRLRSTGGSAPGRAPSAGQHPPALAYFTQTRESSAMSTPAAAADSASALPRRLFRVGAAPAGGFRNGAAQRTRARGARAPRGRRQQQTDRARVRPQPTHREASRRQHPRQAEPHVARPGRRVVPNARLNEQAGLRAAPNLPVHNRHDQARH